MAFSGSSIKENDRASAYTRGLEMPAHANYVGKRYFHLFIRQLSNSMIVRALSTGSVHYKLFNPSLGDFLLKRYAKNFSHLTSIFKCLRSRDALDVIIDMSLSALIGRVVKDEMILSLLENERAWNSRRATRNTSPDSTFTLTERALLGGQQASQSRTRTPNNS